MASPPSARWRPPNSTRSLAYYRWMSWFRLALVAIVVATQVQSLVRGGSVVIAVMLLFVAAFIGSTAVWTLQGIHAITRQRAQRSNAAAPDDAAPSRHDS